MRNETPRKLPSLVRLLQPLQDFLDGIYSLGRVRLLVKRLDESFDFGETGWQR